MPPRADTGPYRINEKVLVPYTDKHYTAKVTKAERTDDGFRYLVHYTGWNKQFDEWIELGGLRKFDAALANKPAADEKEAASKPRSRKPAEKKRQPLLTPGGVQHQQQPQVPPLRCELPPLMKRVLVDDHQHICRGGSYTLPHTHDLPECFGCVGPTVSEILAQYVEAFQQTGESSDTLMEEVATGLCTYFDKALHVRLLYNAELHDAEEIQVNGLLPCKMYGMPHLLRLLAILPELVPMAGISTDQRTLLQESVDHFLHFLLTQLVQEHAPAMI